ncbi:MAG: hypothetical protein NW226_19570 [Microscillaceae bacterium]|nr:hypothetical protein [Microscillaceae bacterium]
MRPLKKETPKLLNKEEVKTKLIEGIEILKEMNAELSTLGKEADELLDAYTNFKKKAQQAFDSKVSKSA